MYMEDEDLYRIKARERRGILYGSFLMCLLSGALIGAAMGTQFWVKSYVSSISVDTYSGTFHAGLFSGQSDLKTLAISHYGYITVCAKGKCMYSCADTKEGRQDHLDLIMSDRLNDTEECAGDVSSTTLREISKSPLRIMYESNREDEPAEGGDTIADHVSPTDGLLSQGLWGTTIACLSMGLLFAVLGAVFAVINTATTPVEAISGIPGLIIWNCSAAALLLIAVICWSVQFSTHLSENVLIVESKTGWTTKGNEKLGYSFWLVVVAIVVHLANLGLIAFGTYEPKVKEKIQEPDKATNDILLY